MGENWAGSWLGGEGADEAAVRYWMGRMEKGEPVALPVVFPRDDGTLFGASTEDDAKIEAARRLRVNTHFVAYEVDDPGPEKREAYCRERERLRAERN
jgi:hypothetical protein